MPDIRIEDDPEEQAGEIAVIVCGRVPDRVPGDFRFRVSVDRTHPDAVISARILAREAYGLGFKRQGIEIDPSDIVTAQLLVGNRVSERLGMSR